MWVAGQLLDESWVNVAADPDALAAGDVLSVRHIALTRAADEAGQRWLVEIYDPDKPEAQAYVRFGTDAVGMVDPQVVADLAESLRGRY